MIIRSLDVRIVNVFVSTAIRVRLYNTCFSGIVFFFSGNKVTATPKSKGARTPMYLWDEDYNAYKKQYAS